MILRIASQAWDLKGYESKHCTYQNIYPLDVLLKENRENCSLHI